mgnify:CR=1 FL=1
MKNYALMILTCIFTFIGHAQFNQSAPWMTLLNTDQRSDRVKFHDIVDAFNTYWADKDPYVKGSGYKPFKRWEAYWQNFVDSEGYLPSEQEYWDS